MEELSSFELNSIRPGEPITLTTIMAVLVIGVIAVVLFKLFGSQEGTAKIPGGWSFDWGS